MFSIDSKKPFTLVFGGRKGAICKKFGIYVVNSIIKSTATLFTSISYYWTKDETKSHAKLKQHQPVCLKKIKHL
jgi:hypothetical protein